MNLSAVKCAAERLGENPPIPEFPARPEELEELSKGVAALPKEYVSGHALRKRRKPKLSIVKPFKSA